MDTDVTYRHLASIPNTKGIKSLDLRLCCNVSEEDVRFLLKYNFPDIKIIHGRRVWSIDDLIPATVRSMCDGDEWFSPEQLCDCLENK